MEKAIADEIRKHQEFAKSIKIEHYSKTKAFLDEIALKTARESTEGMVILIKELEESKKAHG